MLELVDEAPDRHASSGEYRLASENLGIRLDDRAVRHGEPHRGRSLLNAGASRNRNV